MKITKTAVDRMTSGQIISDEEIKGFVARKLDSGAVTFGFRYRDRMTGKQRWLGLGLHGNVTAEQARTFAKKRAGEVADRKDPVAEQAHAREAAAKAKQIEINTVDTILNAFVKRHASKLRSADQIEGALDRHVRPALGSKSIYDLKRSEVVTMLDKVEDEAGPVMADRVLAHIRKAFNWQATRDEEFKSPIVRGMSRSDPGARSRHRTLEDDEIRDVWKALDVLAPKLPACYAPFVKSLLLCATRRNESPKMNSAEIDGDIWTIPAQRYKRQPKHKNLDHAIPLSAQAKALIGDKPEGFKGNAWFIFSTTGGAKPFSGFSKAKKLLDAEIAKIRKAEGQPKMARWTLHDLRRTARTLMSRAAVSEDHAERALGHVIGGVRGTYDRYEYLDEKRAAFEALAGLVDMILRPRGQTEGK